MNLILNLTTQGLINGAIYALVAIGLAMVFGLLRVLHIAHAGLFTLGGYLGLVITNATGSFALGMLLSMVIVAGCGMLMYRFCYEPILEQLCTGRQATISAQPATECRAAGRTGSAQPRFSFCASAVPTRKLLAAIVSVKGTPPEDGMKLPSTT